MKNLKFNEKLKNRIAIGGLSFILATSGFVLGKTTSETSHNEIVDEHLEDYINKRSQLEKEIDELLKEKEKLQNHKTFNIDDLIVIEHVTANEQPNLYILYTSPLDNGIYYEFHDVFKAWYRMHEDTQEHVYDFCSQYVHFNEGQPLFNYLTDEEIEKIISNNGKITTLELDQISNRIKEEYKEKSVEKTKAIK